jgi:hypothetical protein
MIMEPTETVCKITFVSEKEQTDASDKLQAPPFILIDEAAIKKLQCELKLDTNIAMDECDTTETETLTPKVRGLEDPFNDCIAYLKRCLMLRNHFSLHSGCN